MDVRPFELLAFTVLAKHLGHPRINTATVRMSILPALREHIRLKAEDRPGVYRMIGGEGQVVYVGKSVRVRSRVLSYFNAGRGEKGEAILREARAVEWEYVPNEFAALLREMRLIQRHRPRYNVQHKRRPAYCFVKITRELAPRIVAVTRVGDDDAVYFGPFPRARRVSDAVLELARVMGIRDCPASTPVFFADQLEMFGSGRAPRCLRGDVGTCLAPCAGRSDAATYAGRVTAARRWLEGKGEGPIDHLMERMAEAVTKQDYEYAAVLRDRAETLRELRGQMAAWKGEIDELNFLYRVPGYRGDDRLYLVRRGRVCAELDYPKTAECRARANAMAEEIFARREASPRGLERDEAAETLFVAAWFRSRPDELKRTRSPREWLSTPRGR
jgi:excinuclease ABC subunit C